MCSFTFAYKFSGVVHSTALVFFHQATGSSVLPFGLENENKILAGVNALELTSQFTSYWRFKSIVEDVKKNAVTVLLVCIRQPDRHGKMGSVVCLYPRCTAYSKTR